MNNPDFYHILISRRTIKAFKSDPISDEMLEHILSAGIWAQNHKLTQPWRFIVLGPHAQEQMAQLDPKLKLKPLIVAVTCLCCADPFRQREDYAAVCCAIQNIQLAAWAEGVGMQWSTGRVALQAENYARFHIDPQAEELIGLLYFGYPAEIPPAQPRKPLSAIMRWIP
jgi:nitroreductase